MARTRMGGSSSEVRMGPLALFTLMILLGLALLAVLAASTANATLVMAQRRADATEQLYLDETAAQTFLARLDELVAAGTTGQDALRLASEAALDTAPDRLQVSTNLGTDGSYLATFDAGNGRQLDITVSFGEDGRLAVQKWRMTTVVNDEPTMGNLFGSS